MDEPTLLGWPISAWKDVVEAAAVLVAGASLTHRITHRTLNSDLLVLHINVLVSNPGVIVLRIAEAVARVQQVLPLPEGVREVTERGEDPVPHGEREVP